MTVEISNTLKKRFLKDSGIPISLVQEPYFSYYIDMFDALFCSKEKYINFCDLVERLGGEESFFNKSKKITDTIISDISNSEAFLDFSKMDMSVYKTSGSNIGHKNIYTLENSDSAFASFDLIKANYTALKFVNKEIVLGSSSYEELVGRYTSERYFIESKHIRQVIFGHLCPNRQLTIQKHIIQSLVVPEILKIIPDPSRLISASDDEVVIKFQPFEFLYKDFIEGLKNFKSGVPIRYTPFILRDLGGKNLFYKEFTGKTTPRIEFKAVPQNNLAECYKYYLKQKPNEFDMCYFHDGRIVKFMEPLFKESDIA